MAIVQDDQRSSLVASGALVLCAAGLLPDRMIPAYNRFAQYGIFVLFAFLLIPKLTWVILGPAHFLYTTWAGTVLGMPVLS